MRERKSEEQLTKDLETLLRKLYNRMEGTDEEKRKVIDEKVKTSIQSVKRDKRTEVNNEEFIKAAMEDPDINVLAKMFGCHRSTAFRKMNKLGISSKREIATIIKQYGEEKSDEQIAQEAHVNVDVVIEIREKLQEKESKVQKGKKRKEPKITDDDFIKAAMENPDRGELSRKFGYSREYINQRMKKLGICTKTQIEKIIKEQGEEKSNEEIAQEAHVNVGVVIEIREKLEEKEGKVQKGKKRKGPKITDDDFIKAAMENPDVEQLAKQFGYSRAYIWQKMKKLGICTKTQIEKIIKEQEKSNEEIAQEAHVSPEIVETIRQNGIGRRSKQSSKQERNNEQKEFMYEATRNPDTKQLADKFRVTRSAINSRMNRLGISNRQENGDDVAIDRRLEVSEAVAEVERKKAEEREKSFVELASNLASREQIQNQLRFNEYDIILLLRKHGILSREDVERLIETTNMSDEEIANKSKTSIEAVANVRKVVDDRERLISKIPEDKIRLITRMIKSQNATSYIKDKTRVSSDKIDALKVKVLRDKDQNIPETEQRIEYNKTIMSIRYGTQGSKDSSVLDFRVSKILALYERFLTPKDKALIAYAYLQCNCYLKSMQFSEKYLGLTTPTTEANKQLIKRIIDEEAQKEEAAKSLRTPPTDVGGGHGDR